MKTPRSLTAIVEEQCRKWTTQTVPPVTPPRCSVITVSREPGTRARAVAQLLSQRLGYDIYGSNIVDAVARSAHCSEIVVRSLDERGRSFVENFVSSVGRSLTADEYLHHLALIVATLARHRRAIILGRGASFLLPHGTTLRVRFVAPLEMRIASFVKEFSLTPDEARQRIRTIENNRRKFVLDAFGKDLADPVHYDLIVNDDLISAEGGARLVLAALESLNA